MLRVPNFDLKAPFGDWDRYEIRALFRAVEDQMSPAEVEHVMDVLYSNKEMEERIEAQANELLQAFTEMLQTFLYQATAKHDQEVLAIKQKLEALKNAGS